MASGAARGEVWLADLNPVRGHEQAGTRPCVVLSVDRFNAGLAGLVVVLPMTTTDRRLPLHVAVAPPEAGLRRPTFIKCEDIRSIATECLVERWGSLDAGTMLEVADRMRILLDL